MVKFVFGGGGSGKSEYVFTEIERLLRETDKKICLIVPEQYTVSTEAKAARRLPPSAPLRFEATNFTRLGDSIARVVGGLSYTHLTKGARMLLLWRAMLSVWPSLSELNRSDDSDGTGLIPTVFAAEGELRRGGITPAALAAAAEAIADGDSTSLSRRAYDLSLICSAAEELMTEEFGKVEEPVSRLTRDVAESGYFKNTCVILDSFYSLTGAQTAAVSEIIRCADSVIFTIPMENRHADGIHLDGVRRYYESALSAALRHGEVEFVNLTGNHRAKFEELQRVQDHLWDYLYAPAEGETTAPSVPDSVRVVYADDRYDEAEKLCAHIGRLVREGARYSDIAVACSSAEAVRGICDSAMRRHGIPAFFAETARLSSSPAVRLMLSLLRIPGKWRHEDVVSIVKTGISPLSDSLACTFESYTDIWSIRGKRGFTTPWSMNPDGYRQEISTRGKQILLDANEARELLIPDIKEFCAVFDGGKATVREVCAAIVEYFSRSGAYRKMMLRADSLEAEGYADDAARERLVWREICDAFDTMVTLIGDIPVDSGGFATLFRYVITDADTGAIPTGVDVVTVAGASALRTDGVKHMILLGALEGEFPSVPEEKGYFSDDDREKLAEAGVTLGGDTGERMSEELFRFGRAVSQASDSLTVFVPKASGSAPATPSEGAVRVLSLLGRDAPESPGDIPYVYDSASLISAERRLGSDTLTDIRREILGSEAREFAYTAETAAVDPSTAAQLFGNHLRLSQSRIDSFVKCPMAYYCRYVLRLSEDNKAELAAPDVGIFVHAVLEELLRHIGSADAVPEGDELTSLCDSLCEDYIRRTCGEENVGRLHYLFLRLKRQVRVFGEAIAREYSQSRFETYSVELPVGISAENAELPSPPSVRFPLAEGGEVSLHGIIDRLDVYRRDGKTFIRVIDYKTGRTKFSYDDVQLGLNIQLLLYLFSAWRSEGSPFHRELDGGKTTEIVPAGALYFNLRPGDQTSDVPLSAEEAKEQLIDSMERSGVVTDDRDVLDAMDSGITGRYVPVSLKADGSYKKSASLATLERFGELEREMCSTVSRIATEMKRGDAMARPLDRHGKSPCDYCKMKTICRREKKK